MTNRPNVIRSDSRIRAYAASRAMIAAFSLIIPTGAWTGSATAAGFTPTATFNATVTQGNGNNFIHTAMAPDGTAFVTWPSPSTPAIAMVGVHPPGGSWAVQELGATQVLTNGGVPISVASDGTATVLIAGIDGAVRVADRPPGGAFQAPRALTVTGRKLEGLSLAVSRNGNAVAAWFDSPITGPTTWQPRARIREGGGWSGPTFDITPAFAAPTATAAMTTARSAVAINDRGRAAVGITTYDGTYGRARVALREPDGDLGAAAPLDTSAQNSSWIDLAITDGGAVAATYATESGTGIGLRATGNARFVAAGGTAWGTTSTLTPSRYLGLLSPPTVAGGPGEAFSVAISRTATTTSPIGEGQIAWGKAVAAGGSWVVLPTSPVSLPQEQATVPDLAMNARGDRFLAWVNSGDRTVRGAFAAAGALEFGAPQTAQPGSATVSSLWPSTSVDDAGNAIAGWSNNPMTGGVEGRTAAAGFDTVAPTISNLSIPGTGPAVFPIPFSATATDAWSTPKLKWSFGDGATTDGSSATHSYESPNTYDASVTATDDAGNSSSLGGRIAVALGDRDGDGVLSDRDCDDGNAGVRPGIRDIPGNGLDENCDGADAKFGTLATTVRLDWILTRRGVRITSLGVRGVKLGDTIKLSCTGRGCPKKLKQQTVTIKKEPKKAQISLSKYAAGASLPAGAKLDVSVSRPDYKTRSTTWTVRRSKGPRESVRCQIPGAKRSEPCA